MVNPVSNWKEMYTEDMLIKMEKTIKALLTNNQILEENSD